MTDFPRRADVVVVGGGPTALATAAAARRAGGEALRLGVDAPAAGRHYALGLRARRFLKNIGAEVAGAPAKRFWLFPDGRGGGRGGGKKVELRADECGLDSLCEVVDENELLTTLQRAAQGVPQAPGESLSDLHCGAAGAALRADGVVRRASLLAAADGARSRLAALAGVGVHARPFGQAALTMTATAPLPDDVAAQWFSHHNILALLPLPGGGKFSMIWSLPTDEARRLAQAGVDATAQAAANKTGMAELTAWKESGKESGPENEAGVFPLAAARRAARVFGRTVFVGEAARVVHPLAGQGLNLALRDAEDLIGRASRFADWGEPAALSSHAAARTLRAETTHRATRFFAEAGAGATAGILSAGDRIRPLLRAAARFANGY